VKRKRFIFRLLMLGMIVLMPYPALGADYHHVHILAPSPLEAVRWYTNYLDCDSIIGRSDAVSCDNIEIIFVAQSTLGGTQGTGINHIAFSVPNVENKMTELEMVGVYGSGVRLQRFSDGSIFQETPDLYKTGFIFDPWGTRIELVEDKDLLGFHHIHLSSLDPEATLLWYQKVFGGELAILKGQVEGVLLGDAWILVSEHSSGSPAPTQGRTLDHLGFVVPDLSAVMSGFQEQGIDVQFESLDLTERPQRVLLLGPDDVQLAVVELGWISPTTQQIGMPVAVEAQERYLTPLTPWGEPDLQGIWTGDAAHGIPLERPPDSEQVGSLTPEEAAARRERGTLNSIWGYEREWRDTTLGYAKNAPSTQVSLIIDPSDGRLPPMTRHGASLVAAAASAASQRGLPAGPEDLSTDDRCITRGLPGLMLPRVYNNGLQIIQGPGYVAIQKEMVHETRVIPTTERPHLGASLTQWLGDSRGHWEGETLVVEAINFNGKAPFRGSGESMRLIERYTRVGPTALEYTFTVDDSSIWVSSWTGMFHFGKDDDQYELVEYACHEGNYGLTGILSGARATEREFEEAAANQ
jgi:catechol 2,3-dioxygenase-like lactoylglutathione lyase family enzyme